MREPAEPHALPGLQLTWLDGDVVAWQPSRTAYGGNLHQSITRSLGVVPASGAGAVRVARLALPDGTLPVMCQRLDVGSVAALAQLGALHASASPSVAWFAAVYRAAAALADAGRVVPLVVELEAGWWAAWWQPVQGDLDAVVPALAAAMPPVVASADRVEPLGHDDVARQVLVSFTDQVTRTRLQLAGWHAPVSDTRRPTARAMRMIARALAAPVPRFRPDRDLVEATREITAALVTSASRAEGQPAVRCRLRLGLPDGDGRWPLTLELADVDDPSRWCTAHDVDSATEASLAVAGTPRWMPHLAEQLQVARLDLAAVAPWLDEWQQQPGDGIDVDQAAATLAAVDVLGGLGIDLVSPQRLARRTPSTRGTARPRDDASGRFGAATLVDWEVVLDDTPVDEAILRRAADAGATLVDVGGRWVQLSQADARRALASLADHRARHGELSTLELVQLSAQLAAAALDRSTAAGDGDTGAPGDPAAGTTLVGGGWIDDLLQGLPDTRLEAGVAPAGFAATLRPYQERGLGWLQFLHRLGLGGCLADDMGLGKTPTTLAHLAGLPGPHLVVCPLSVVRNWENEIARFHPLARVMVHHGTGRVGADGFAHHVGQHDLVVTTYQVAARDIDLLAAVRWSVAVFDEAQALKNPDTRTAKAMRRIDAGQRIALTGTPVENRLSELWSILAIVTPGLLGSQQQFRTRFALPIERRRDDEAAAALRRLTSPFLLRRTKADRSLVPDLPDKVEQLAWAPLTREQASMYQSVVDQLLVDAQATTGMRRRGLVLAALTRLKQICNHPAHALGDGSRLAGRSGKLIRFDELVTDLLDAGEQALVFTQFREMGLLLQRHLHERFTLEVPFLHGGVTKTARDRMVHQFQDGTAPAPLLLVSLKAGGTGLNLTAASRVVHYDRWWNPAVEDQATDRAWRIGQSRSVFVHKLVCQGTIEERVDALINDKRALADAVVGPGGETWLSELSTDQLRDLVVLDHAATRQA